MMTAIEQRKEQRLKEALQALFTDWQIEIIRKRLQGERLSDSERVEYSRQIRKVLLAIDAE